MQYLCPFFFYIAELHHKGLFWDSILWIYNLNSKTHFNFAFITETYPLPVEVMENHFKIPGTGSEIVVKKHCQPCAYQM